ncbi:MAG: ATP-binding protein [Candidatus Neomarinimicrobiota bacterium]
MLTLTEKTTEHFRYHPLTGSTNPTTTKVLIVEDDKNIAKNLSYYLCEMNYSLCGVIRSGEELLERINEYQPQVILMDIQLAGELDGIATVEKLNRIYDIPVIYLSARTDMETLSRARATGQFGYLIKPVNPLELHFTIQMSLYKHEADSVIQSTRDWLQTALNSIGDGVISTDPCGVVTFVNPVAENILTTTRDQLFGQNIHDNLYLIDDNEINSLFISSDQVIEDEQSRKIAGQILVNRKKGTEIPIDGTVSPIIRQNGNFDGSIFVFRDITSRIENEKSQKLLGEQLRHSQKMEAIGLLAGGIAHEFNNIIASISSYAQVAITQISPDAPTLPYYQTILRKLDHATVLTRKLLTMNRKQDLNFMAVDLNQVTGELVRFLRQTIVKDINITFELDKTIKPVRADVNSIEQIITNLCLNARDAIDGHGTIHLSTAQVRSSSEIHDSLTDLTEPEYVQLTVTDNGCGMDEQTLQRIFEPFFTTKSGESGTGLGLSMVYGLMKQHKGAVHCSSQPNIGTIFNLYFPNAAP